VTPTAVCYVVVVREPYTDAASARVRMRMTDDIDTGPTAEVHVQGVDEACSTLRAWLEGLMRS
jgi:hypothetical protein